MEPRRLAERAAWLGVLGLGGMLAGACSSDPASAPMRRTAGSGAPAAPRPAVGGLTKASLLPGARAEERAVPPPRTACPEGMVLVDQYCIDRYEAHLLVKTPDGATSLYPAHERPTDPALVAASSAGVKPQAYISQLEAARACENAGKRLCSLVEWYGACRGAANTTFPYGDDYEPGRCNVGKRHLLSMWHGANPRNWSYRDFNDPRLDQEPGFLALTGEYSECAGPNGVHDLVGNLHEWVADRVDSSLRRKLPVASVLRRRIGRRPGTGIFMGGFFSTTDEHGPGCTFVTTAHEPAYHDYSTGFRCCRDR